MRTTKDNTLRSQRTLQSGVGLIETIIYLALFITISVVLIGSLFGMMRSYTQTRIDNDLTDSAHVAVERMTREIRGALSIDTTTSDFDSNPGVLKLNALDSGGSAKTVQFSVASSVLQMTDSTDGTARDLTGSKVTVTSLIFRKIVTAKGSAVRVEMTLQSTRAGSSKTINLYDTAALRGSY